MMTCRRCCKDILGLAVSNGVTISVGNSPVLRCFHSSLQMILVVQLGLKFMSMVCC